MVLIIILLAAAGIFSIYLFSVCPALSRREALGPFRDFHYAHRGLWDTAADIPENSLAAFAAAADAGYAIELDIHLTKDGQIIVFHDDTTDRMCGAHFIIEQTGWETLSELQLDGTAEHIPLLSEVLSLVDGRVPLLIELKLPLSDLSLCSAVMKLLDEYPGPYVIESFNTLGLFWMRKNRPDVLRGQLSARFPRDLNLASPARWLTTSLMVNLLGRPHFIAYHLQDTDTAGFRTAHRLFRAPVFLWTVRTDEQLQACRQINGTAIFEQIRP